MTPVELADIHHKSFEHAPRPWTIAEFQFLLSAPNTHLFHAPNGFAFIRVAGSEAELLTIAVHPDFRRQRIAQNLLKQLGNFARDRDISEIFLEVSAENEGARRLYDSCGYAVSGHRKGYYTEPGGKKIDAIVMRYVL
ncbi:MAG: ribosomal protein S18-alanine N-acetyltransferase [Paracoccaceae bacterium]